MTAPSNPLEAYIHEQIRHFGDESKRLGTTESLVKFKSIIDAFLQIQRTIGTLQHDVALDLLKKEFAFVRQDILLSVKRFWTDFWWYRRLATQSARSERDRKKAEVAQMQAWATSIERLRADGSPLAGAAEEAYRAALELDDISLDMSEGWRGMSWTGLWVDSKLLAIYTRYIRNRIRVFMQFHSFIFFVPILVLGIGYSFASKGAIEQLTSTFSSLPWLGPVALVALYALKKYVIDKKLKTVQKRVEERLFRPLSAQLMIARTVVLQTETLRKGRKQRAASAA
jgi:hypothetical protein